MTRLLALCLLFASAASGQTEFSLDNARDNLRVLSVDIGPRPMGSPAEARALAFAVEKFRLYGCDTAYVMPIRETSSTNTTSGVAVGIKRGETKRMIAVGGHIDSAGPEIPGTNDDGSGSAAVIEACRVLCRRPHQATLVFLCFGGEEQGLIGSKHFVGHFPEIDSLDLMVQLDMTNGLGRIELDPDTRGASAPQWLVRAAVEEFNGLGYSNLGYATHFNSLNYASSASAGSDHEPFLEAGIPAIDFTTDVTDPIHTPRDNFENFDPRGLKRSGDLAVRLVERFDGAVPSRSTENYWLYFVDTLPIFLPLWGVWAFAAAAFAVGAVAFVRVRRLREPRDQPGRIRWSGLKIFLFALVAFAVAWFLPDAVGAVRGWRYAWMTSINTYYLLFGLSFLAGLWVVARIAGRLKLSRCPHVFFLRSVIILALITLLFGLLNVKLMMEPAAGLLLLSLAVLVRPAWPKALLFILSPVWMIRILCSEWAPLYYRIVAVELPARLSAALIFGGVMILLASLYTLPFLYGGMALARLSPPLGKILRIVGTTTFAAVVGVAWLGLAGYLLTVPVYNDLWYRSIKAEESYHLERGTKEVLVKSSEYLTGLRVVRQGMDSTVTERRTELRLGASPAFDTTWTRVSRNHERIGETTNVCLVISSVRRPYEVRVTYTPSGNGTIGEFQSEWAWKRTGDAWVLRWYAFPDSELSIPVTFTASGADSVNERVEVTFAELADPLDLSAEKAYILPRTTFVSEAVYRR